MLKLFEVIDSDQSGFVTVPGSCYDQRLFELTAVWLQSSETVQQRLWSTFIVGSWYLRMLLERFRRAELFQFLL